MNMQGWLSTGLLVLCVLHGAAALAAGANGSSRVQCWTDKNGQRACGDSVPPEYVHQQREIFDDQGRVRQIKPREKTAAEIAAEEAAAKEADAAAQRAQKQRDYDRFLLSTYNSDKEIERARDERVAMVDGRQKLTEKAIADNEKAIAQQQSRIDNVRKSGKTPGEVLTKKLAELQQTLADNKTALGNYATEKQQISDKYNADLARYRELNKPPTTP
ncbi:hypothetical protein [Solimonas terrae]|uniref:DUF4124 domain-containing protein n=1 Tax=Solimonas terrae TaxID=1396819 RepID=A0A6M2BWE1_9GAMM|nr:hypothetical protein [Solimonas terrae]NGY06660.1 hypothetical protein [Solimonas terrae]